MVGSRGVGELGGLLCEEAAVERAGICRGSLPLVLSLVLSFRLSCFLCLERERPLEVVCLEGRRSGGWRCCVAVV